MAEEPRRSIRATKGQHTKGFDLLDAPPEPPKKKSTKKAKKVVAEPVEEVIRCVCGVTETGPEDEEPWIACDKCEAWQHNVCVGVSTFDDEIPKKYLCEKCGPAAHKELLDGIKRGERIWEVRRANYEMQKQDAEEGLKKKNKKKKRTSTPIPKEVAHPPTSKAKASPAPPPPPPPPPQPPAVPIAEPKEKKEQITPSGSTKRKARDNSHDKEAPKEPHAKVRKTSAAHISPRQEVVPSPRQESPPHTGTAKIIDLEASRQGGAKAILKGLHPTLLQALKNGHYILSKDATPDSKAERLACQIEEAVFTTHPDKGAYNKQCRSLAYNLKHNSELVNGLLSRNLTPSALAVMTSDDMASKELKRETAEMKARADKQSIMVTDDGPRIRRTHKGEEIVEGDSSALPSDNTMSTSRRRSQIDPNGEMTARSRENSYENEVELPENIDTHRSRDDIRAKVVPKHPLNIETKQQPTPVRKVSASDNFDINKVFSSVQSPTSASHMRRPSTFLPNAPPANGPGVDAEIDKMLQDDGNESPPYSPAEYDDDPEIIWRGSVTMDSIAKFPGVARLVAGADVSKIIPWGDILQKDLKIAGRIDQEKANEYLCSLRYSPPTDIVVVNVTPQGEAASQGFNDLYEYFQSRTKYGVLANKGVGNIRDTYLVPVPPSPGKLPDFISNLEGHKMQEERIEKSIVIALVIRHEDKGEAKSPTMLHHPQSPSVMNHPQRQMSMSGTAPNMSPIPPQGNNPFSHPTQPVRQGQGSQEPSQGFQGLDKGFFEEHVRQAERRAEDRRTKDQREGEAAAIRILGEHVQAPTVAFLMPQAYQMREGEWEIIREILSEDERARGDLQHLSHMLEIRMSRWPADAGEVSEEMSQQMEAQLQFGGPPQGQHTSDSQPQGKLQPPPGPQA